MIQRKQTLPIHGIINRDIAKTFMNVRISKNTQKIFLGISFLCTLFWIIPFYGITKKQEKVTMHSTKLLLQKAILQCSYKLKWHSRLSIYHVFLPFHLS